MITVAYPERLSSLLPSVVAELANQPEINMTEIATPHLLPARLRGRRPYVLGLRREQWVCLRYGHRRREIPGANLCTICAPCWVCSNTEVDHDAWACEIAAEKAKASASSSVPSRGTP